MMADAKRSGLGRGLSALIGDDVAPSRAPADPKTARTLPVSFLKPNPNQPRKTFTESELEDLTTSIREKGIIQPILVRPIKGVSDSYEIVAGERRWRAAQRAKLHDVPVVIRDLSDSETLELAIIENVQRADLNAIEEAAAYQDLMDRFKYTQEQIAKEVGKSRPHIANTVRLLRLPESVKSMLRDGRLTAGHARTLVGAPDAEARALAIVEAGLNVRDAEHSSEKIKKAIQKSPAFKDPDTAALERQLAERLGLQVEINHRGEAKGGEVKIRYKTLEQLDEICRRLGRT
ncbi:MAG TPA: ParB/RepB/Spo0J family partition protein [Rhizomicrobium sp.]|nr:ParB/RepB/Spo0J family partition protein [Rhizomicrobium sp.]